MCLGCEVFGRSADDLVRVVPAMVAEKARGLPPLVRRGATQALADRWWGLLAVATQRLGAGADLVTSLLEDPPGIADLRGWMGRGRRSPPAASRGRLSQRRLGIAG